MPAQRTVYHIAVPEEALHRYFGGSIDDVVTDLGSLHFVSLDGEQFYDVPSRPEVAEDYDVVYRRVSPRMIEPRTIGSVTVNMFEPMGFGAKLLEKLAGRAVEVITL